MLTDERIKLIWESMPYPTFTCRSFARLIEAEVMAEAQPVCKCSLRTRLVGDGCEVCNPDLAAEIRANNERDEKEAHKPLGPATAEDQKVYDAMAANYRAEAQWPVALPIPPAGIITHQNLGELYDRLQMQQYAMKYADITAQQMPAPCPGCVELESKWLSEQARNLAEEADYEHMSIDVFAMQAKVAELEARPAARYMNTNARLETIVAEQSAEIERLKVCVEDEREVRQRVERGAVAGREQQAERIAELEAKEFDWAKANAKCTDVIAKQAALIEKCEDALRDYANQEKHDQYCGDACEALASIAAQKS